MLQQLALKIERKHIIHILGRKEWWCDDKDAIAKHDVERLKYLEHLNLKLKKGNC